MFRFLSGRKGRSDVQSGSSHNIKSKHVPNKNLIQCKVILLDGTDLSVELSVSKFRNLHKKNARSACGRRGANCIMARLK